MLQCVSLAFHLPDKPAGLREIAPHWHFERSQNFFRFAGKALAVGHRWADVKAESYTKQDQYHLTVEESLRAPIMGNFCSQRQEGLFTGDPVVLQHIELF